MNQYKFNIIAAFIAAMAMGSVGVIARLASVDAVVFAFFRLLLATTFLYPVTIYLGQHRNIGSLFDLRNTIQGVLVAGFIYCYIESIIYIDMVVAVSALYVAPILATIIGFIFLNEKLSFSALLSLVIGVLGFSTVILSGAVEPTDVSSKETQGVYFALAAMAFYALYLVMNRLNKSADVLIVDYAVRMLIGSLLLLPMVVQTELHFSQLSWAQWGWLISAGLIPGAIGLGLNAYSSSKLPLATFSVISYSEIVMTLVLASMVFGENYSLTQIAGCGLVIISGCMKLISIKPSLRGSATQTQR